MPTCGIPQSENYVVNIYIYIYIYVPHLHLILKYPVDGPMTVINDETSSCVQK